MNKKITIPADIRKQYNMSDEICAITNFYLTVIRDSLEFYFVAKIRDIKKNKDQFVSLYVVKNTGNYTTGLIDYDSTITPYHNEEIYRPYIIIESVTFFEMLNKSRSQFLSWLEQTVADKVRTIISR